ncbi:MAG: hypothetical protein AAF388_08120 [Bacteroidota bacterium]
MTKSFSLVIPFSKSSVVKFRNAFLLAGMLMLLFPQQSQAQVLIEADLVQLGYRDLVVKEVRKPSLTQMRTHQVNPNSSTYQKRQRAYPSRINGRGTRSVSFSSQPNSTIGRYDLSSFYYLISQWIGIRP